VLRTVGDWAWVHQTTEDGVLVTEYERWHFDWPDGAEARGTYRRDTAFVSLDGTPFVCAQRASYVQSALFEVRAFFDGGLVVEEVDYRALPSPCEHGLRHTARYDAFFDGADLVLAWDGGSQTLEPAPPEDVSLPIPPPTVAGPWRWHVTSLDRSGLVRDEVEAWELAVADDGAIAGTYVRTVTTASPDGTRIPCAGAPRWSFTDRYLLRGNLAHLAEVAVDAGAHPCLEAHPDRHLDAAWATTVGDHLLLTWRGNRTQVLHRATDSRR
jgi:hypothetical protein